MRTRMKMKMTTRMKLKDKEWGMENGKRGGRWRKMGERW